MKTRACLIAIWLLLLPHCAPGDDHAVAEDQQDLTKEPSLTFGTWKSTTCETVDEKTFQLRTYRIAANGIYADWTRYSSPRCTPESILMTIRMGGSAKIDRLSKVAPHTFEIRVLIDERAIVPASKAGIERLEGECSGPAWRSGIEVDVTKTGCGALVPPNELCPIEYDLMRLSGRRLLFGDRAKPLCTEATRPTKLSVWSVDFDSLF